MSLAIFNGLLTSIILETNVLTPNAIASRHENSFGHVIDIHGVMEAAMNLTDSSLPVAPCLPGGWCLSCWSPVL